MYLFFYRFLLFEVVVGAAARRAAPRRGVLQRGDLRAGPRPEVAVLPRVGLGHGESVADHRQHLGAKRDMAPGFAVFVVMVVVLVVCFLVSSYSLKGVCWLVCCLLCCCFPCYG